MSIFRKVLVWGLALALLAGCGGGSDEPPTPTPPPTSAPQIQELSPNPVQGSDNSQTIVVRGAGFVDKPIVTMAWTGVPSRVLASTQVQFVSATQLNISITTSLAPDDWTIEVTNPDGRTSNILPFTVVAPGACLPSVAAGYLDDYPHAADIADTLNPKWNFYIRNCTDYVAWRLNRNALTQTAPYFFTNTMRGGQWSNAQNWDENALALGYRVSATPEVGAIAHWNSGDPGISISIPGHVAYVERVNADGSVDVSEYNFKRFAYSVRCGIRPPRFVHVPTANLPAGQWNVSGVDQAGTTWTGSTLTFESQTLSGNSYSVSGHFYWRGSSGSFGRENFTGTLDPSGALLVMGNALVAPTFRIVLGIYSGNLSTDGRRIVNGSWTGVGIPSDSWSAVQQLP